MRDLLAAYNKLQEAETELELVTPFKSLFPDYYQRVHDEWVRASERYERALAGAMCEPVPAPMCEPEQPMCDIDDVIDDEDYDEDDPPPAIVEPPVPPTPSQNLVGGGDEVVDIGEDLGADQPEDEQYGPDNPFRIDELTRDSVPEWLDVTDEDYYQFKRAVYLRCVRRASSRRRFVRGIPEESRGRLRRLSFRRELIDDGEDLLESAEAALAEAQGQGDERALRATIVPIRLASAYRDADHQFRLWNGRFTDTYVTRHQRMLEGLEGDPLSEEWIARLARAIGGATATPGYSLHQRGISLDFQNPQPGIRNQKTPAAMQRWRDTWFHAWLVDHAAEFGFEPYDGEAWHWNYTALMEE
jgi:hypothetical protein